MRWVPAALAVCGVGLWGCSAPEEKALKMTVVPYEAAQRLSEDYGPMADYLAGHVGLDRGTFVPVVAYSGVLAALQSDQVDVAYLSAFPYVLAQRQMKLQPLAMPHVKGSLMYHGIIFVRADSPIKKLDDLKGKTFAFGDPTSTTGYLLPRALLERKGIPVGALKKWYNAGDANMVVQAVENGTADAGAAYDLVFEVAYREHPEKAKGMRVIAQTEEIPNGIYVARPGLPADQVRKLQEAFMSMNTDPRGREVMLKAPNDKIVPPDDALFNHVRETTRVLNIDLGVFEKKQ